MTEPLIDQREQPEFTLHRTESREQVRSALHAARGLILLRTVMQDETGRAVWQLLQNLIDPDTSPDTLALAYSHAFWQLAELVNDEMVPQLRDAWQSYLVMRLIDEQNPWSLQVERVGRARVAPALREQARRDLRTLQQLFMLDAERIWQLAVTLVVPEIAAQRAIWMPWLDLAPVASQRLAQTHGWEHLATEIAGCEDWAQLVEPLEQHWERHGTGTLARYHVLRWLSNGQKLSGVVRPDPVQLHNLVGHERQQQRLTTNIKRFLAGLPAQDMLLYGPPGTGKSSTIKALANVHAEAGLHLVEVSKDDIHDLSSIVEQLDGRASHYLLFIDDLSFEEHETAYKALKVMLEGTVQARPANILICATSNRLNLIRENFHERGNPSEDVNWRDTMDEKQALVHRFALRVTFMAPDQRQYLRIVSELARQRGLELPEDHLWESALQWERTHTGRSGRLARQFIDDLEAERG